MARQLRSTITSGGQLELSLVDVETPAPGPDQVVVRVEAAPINPSDLGLLLGPADMSQADGVGFARSPDRHGADPGTIAAGAGRPVRRADGGG